MQPTAITAHSVHATLDVSLRDGAFTGPAQSVNGFFAEVVYD